MRQATASDIAAIAAIERASFSDPWSPTAFRSLLANERVLFALADRGDGTPVGYVVTWFLVEEAEIANLAVESAHRGIGVGAMLLDAALSATMERGITTVYLEVRDSNRAARALYGSRGFEEVGRRRNYYRAPVEDALIMRRQHVTAAPRGSS